MFFLSEKKSTERMPHESCDFKKKLIKNYKSMLVIIIYYL